MEKQITVDGIDYTYENSFYGWNVNQEVITLKDCDGIVAEASVDHNMEHIGVTYYGEYDGDRYTEETSYPYFEYSDDEDLARWMAATHPAI